MSACVRIDKVPVFELDGDGVRVTLFSGTDEIFIHLSRHHCRLGAARLLKLLDGAEAKERVTRLARH